MRLHASLATTVALALIAAGCATGSPSSCEVDECPAPPSVAPEPQFDSTTGAIDGVVVDDEFSPLPGAQVGLKETQHTTNTDDAGRFVFSNLEPGAYTVLAGALGFSSTARPALVEAGATVQVQILLERLASEEPFPEVRIFTGLIECGFGTAAVVGNCIPLQFLFQTLNFNPTNTRTVGLYEVSEPGRVKGGVFEMLWKPSTAGSGQSLGLYVDLEGTGPTSGTNYAQADGPSPVRIVVDERPYKDLKPDENKKKVQTRTFLPGTTPPSFVIDQRFQVFGTACYNAMCADDYTAIKDA